jgi:hypothetical protein
MHFLHRLLTGTSQVHHDIPSIRAGYLMVIAAVSALMPVQVVLCLVPIHLIVASAHLRITLRKGPYRKALRKIFFRDCFLSALSLLSFAALPQALEIPGDVLLLRGASIVLVTGTLLYAKAALVLRFCGTVYAELKPMLAQAFAR